VTITSDNYAQITGTVSLAQDEEESEYTYLYAALTWDEYWASEGVYAAGSTASSTELDTKGETDKGAFDVVSRATANHGLHRGSFQSVAVIYDTNGKTYTISHWTDADNAVLTDGRTLTKSTDRSTNVTNLTLSDGTTATMSYYEVTGIKYVPVQVATADLAQFCEKYTVVENGEALAGGYTEQNLTAYTATADVNENTNGLKVATKNEDGTFSFSARSTGTGSGLAGTTQKEAKNITVTVKKANGSYGEFLRVDLTGDGYGDLGSNMYAVVWTYYGNDSTYTKALQSYGTKFAADNWMHKSMGIQLGLTDSLRCQLPDGTDGTGYWTLTVCAMGYEDYTVKFQATEENIVKTSEEENVDTSKLEALVAQAKALTESDYTAASWKDLDTELSESVEMLASNTLTQAMVDEQVKHLTDALNNLVKAEQPEDKDDPDDKDNDQNGNDQNGNDQNGNTNTGDTNTGNTNAGNTNTGDTNTGNTNAGNTNTGNTNAGNTNTGNTNAGNTNTGDTNTGNTNTGNANTGNANTGNTNTGSTSTDKTTSSTGSTGESTVVKTADESHILLWLGALVVSCLGFVGTVVFGRKKKD
jgi:hypothetical protein